jgi:predicted enzyme related to lactoylglutathione lyase
MSDVPRGRFCWYELYTTDPAAAAAFYTKVTGWGAETWPGMEAPYTMWTTEAGSIGGMMELPPQAREAGAPPHWIAYVSTPDLDGTVARARGMGAAVMWGPMDLPDVGRIAGVKDPQGAMFALLQPATAAPGHDAPARVGEISWHELATDAWADAWTFYADLFDWQKAEAMDMGEMGTYQLFGRGAHPVGAMFDRPPQIPVSNWLLYVRVPDMDAAVHRVKEAGGAILNGPMEVPGGSIAQCMDPQGGIFAVHFVAPQG